MARAPRAHPSRRPVRPARGPATANSCSKRCGSATSGCARASRIWSRRSASRRRPRRSSPPQTTHSCACSSSRRPCSERIAMTSAGDGAERRPSPWRTSPRSPYHLGRALRATQGVPIGLIDASWGGTPAEAWAPRDAIELRPEFAGLVARSPTRVRPQLRVGALWESLVEPFAGIGLLRHCLVSGRGERRAGRALRGAVPHVDPQLAACFRAGRSPVRLCPTPALPRTPPPIPPRATGPSFVSRSSKPWSFRAPRWP